ncbi:MAG: DUF4384 domain-containing protein [Myxococcota bacterium]
MRVTRPEGATPGSPQLRLIRGGGDSDRPRPSSDESRRARAADSASSPTTGPGWRRWLAPATGALAAAAAVAVIVSAAEAPPADSAGGGTADARHSAERDDDPAAQPTTRRKGGVQVGFFVEHNGQVRRGGDGETVHPGDALQFTYSAQRDGYLAIISRDGAGTGSIYHADGDRAAPVSVGYDVTLPHSVVLDDVLGAETLYLVSCAGPASIEPVRAAAQAGPAVPEAPPSCIIDVLTIDKRGR